MERDDRYRCIYLLLSALVVTSGFAIVAYCLDLLPSFVPHAGSDVSRTQLCTDHGELMVSKLYLKDRA